MTTAIPDLWPDDIKVDVLPPLAVLKAQEGLLTRKTQGMLQAKLTTTETENLVQHQLDLIAPSLNFYRERLLSATHNRDMLYPVTITAELSTQSSHWKTNRTASTYQQFVDAIREILHSAEIRGLICSLLARINESNGDHQGNGTAVPGNAPESPNEDK